MNALPGGLVQAVGWALLHFVWKGALVGAATALLSRLLRDSAPQTRYALFCGALLLCLAIPSLDLYRQLGATEPSLPLAPDGPAAFGAVPSCMPWLVAGWALGVAAMALRLALGLLWIGRARRSGPARTDAGWQAYVSRLARHWGIRREISLRIAHGLAGPLTAGWWRPVVLLPAALLTHMPAPLLEALLAHEVAHIRRLDYLVNLAQAAIEALLFYHPVVWWLSRRIRIEREQIADALAAGYIGEPRRLALALERLSQLELGAGPIPQLSRLAQPAASSGLAGRIRQLLRPRQRPVDWRVIVPAAALAALLAGAVLPPLRTAPASAPERDIQALAGLIQSQHALVVDDGSGAVLLQKNADAVAPIASLTKLMTAMVVLDARPDLQAVVDIAPADAGAAPYARSGVPVGTRLALQELVRLTLMSSDNRAAHALARRYPGGMPAFEQALRAKIAALGLRHTALSEPTGLSARNTSTAADMALVVHAAARYPAIAQGTSSAADSVEIHGQRVAYHNTNPLVGQQGWDIQLSKTGFLDAAGRCLVMRLRSSGKSFTLVLLHSDEASALARDSTNIRDALQALAADRRS